MPVPNRQQQPGSPWTNKHRPVSVPVGEYESASIDVSFKDITLSAKSRTGQKSKQILKGLSGHFKAGELTAILGPSGAGKTSLLNILTGFRNDGMRGSVLSNNKVVEPAMNTVRKHSAYILQEDHLCPYFTVQEIMFISAQLKLGNSISNKAKILIIDDILENLFMSETKNTRCSQLSGGQRKRLCICLELIDNPSVIYLDEPTTGLDSSSALQLLRLLSVMSRQQKAVICTIHQPSATIFEMLDHVYVVAQGKCVYQGTPRNVVHFLESINLECPKYHNPADYLLDVISGEFGDYMDKLRMNGSNPMWRNNPDNKLILENKVPLTWVNKTLKTTVLITPPSEYEKILIIMKSIIVQFHRNWTNTYLKLFLHLCLGIFVGCFYTNAGYYGNRTINNIGYFMAVMVYTTFLTMLPATITFPQQLKIIMKERFNNWYNFKTYFFAFFLVNSPLQLLYAWVFILLSFFLSHQLFDCYRLAMFMAVAALTTLIAEYLGIALGTFENPANAIFNGSVFLAVCMILAGFGIFLPHMPIFFYYLSYGSFMRFGFEAMVVAAYGFNRTSLPCPDHLLFCQVKEPYMVIDRMGMDEKNAPMDFALLIGYTIGMIMIAFLCVRKSIKSG